MNVILPNEKGTVGIVTQYDGLQSIGEFNPKYLQEWINRAIDIYGDEEPLCLFLRKAHDEEHGLAHMLVASSDGEDPMIVVCGKYEK